MLRRLWRALVMPVGGRSKKIGLGGLGRPVRKCPLRFEQLEPRRLLNGGPVINEFMAVNDVTLADEDGHFSDWIELHNPGPDPVNLSSWRLTDKTSKLAKWTFGNHVLDSDDYLVVFASGKDRRATGPGAPWHTNFSLKGSGEYLALVRPNGTVASQFWPEYPDQDGDISFGVGRELVNDEIQTQPNRYLVTPTPGAANSAGVLGFVADTKFSSDRGVYSEPFDVAITTATVGAEIYYTTDGSRPTPVAPAATLYTGPVSIGTTTTLRAAAYKDGFQPTDIDTQTYLFVANVADQPAEPAGYPTTWADYAADYEVDPNVVDNTLAGYGLEEALLAIPTVSITADPDDLFGATNGIYSNSSPQTPAEERAASVELIYPDGSEGFQIDAGIRIHGRSSRNHGLTLKHSFRVLFKSEYGEPKLDFPLFPDSTVQQFDQFVLRGSSLDSWSVNEGPDVLGVPRWQPDQATYLRDQWMRDTQLAMGHTSPHGFYVHVYLNGLYWGQYNLLERPTDSFNADYLGGDKDEYDVIKDYTELQSGTKDAWNQMIALATAGLASEAAYQQIQGNQPDGTPAPEYPDYLDVDSLIDYMILHIYSGAEDWPDHNWWAARRRGPQSEGFQFFVWDQEISNDSLVREYTRMETRFEEPISQQSPSFLYGQLIANETFQRKFADRVHELLFHGGLLTPEQNDLRWSARETEIDQSIVAESARWGDSRQEPAHTREGDWLAEMAWMRHDFWPNTHAISLQRFRNVGLYPNVDAPTFDQHGGQVPLGFPLQLAAPLGTIYYTLDGSDPRLPDGSISPAAVAYNGSRVSIVETTLVTARVFDGSGWSALNAARFLVDEDAVPGNLVITELNYHPDDPSDRELAIDPTFENGDFEFIEMTNRGTESIDLAGLQFTDGVEFQLPSGTPQMLAPGELIVLVSNPTAFAARYGATIEIGGTFDGHLSNGGETVTIIDGFGQIVHSFTYDDSGLWPERADGDGSSLEVVDTFGSYSDPDTWWSSYEVGGSPGVPGVGPAADVVITEIMYHPASENELEEYLEIVNRGPAAIDLADWQFDDGVDFTFPSVILNAGEYLVIAADVATFQQTYPTVTNVIGGWSGRLSNRGEKIELVDDLGRRIDRVTYADEGDWSFRELVLDTEYPHETLGTMEGYGWSNLHDGGGRSLELIQTAMSNNAGQNWSASLVDGGSPGAPNTVAASDIAPLIRGVEHFPIVPSSTDKVTVLAEITDERNSGLTVTLHYREDGQAAFTSTTMFDDGLHNDGKAADGLFAGTIDERTNGTVVEFYVQVSDAGANTRTWPLPVTGIDDPAEPRGANAMYQVDNSFTDTWTPGDQPIFRIIMPADDWDYLDAWSDVSGRRFKPNGQMNATFISTDGVNTQVRYNVGVRNRGNGTRAHDPHNLRVNIPHDMPWEDYTALNFNAQKPYSQVLGSAIFRYADIPAAIGTLAQVRVNGTDHADAGDDMYGSYLWIEAPDSDLVANHWPDDSAGDLYKNNYHLPGGRTEATLEYIDDNPDSYRNEYNKQTNVSADDFTGLIHMLDVLNNAPEQTYFADVSQVIDIEQWVRYMGIDTLLSNNEGGLITGRGDDYMMYAGVLDPRFNLVPYDLDSVASWGGSTTRSIWTFRDPHLPGLNRLLSQPQVVQLYYRQLLDLCDTVFSPAVIDPLIEQVLGDYRPDSVAGLKQFFIDRVADVRGQIENDPLSVSTTLPESGGYLRTTDNAVILTGEASGAFVGSVLVNGKVADWNIEDGTWSLDTGAGDEALIEPGLNRLEVTAFSGTAGTGDELESTFIDIWYDAGPLNVYSESGGGVVGGGVTPRTPPASVHLTVRDSYLPGTSILVRVEALDAAGEVCRDLWNATATLSADNGVTMDVDQVTLYNGLGSALVTFTGTGPFDLTAEVSGLQDVDDLTDLSAAAVRTVPAGTLTGTATNWSGVVHVTGDVLVPDGHTLTINPGTLVLLDGVASGAGGADIRVEGDLQSLGTEDRPVTFTAHNAGANWGEIYHVGAEPSLYLYTDITLGGRSPVSGRHSGTGPAFHVSNSTIVFDHVNMTDEAGKVMTASGSDLTFTDSLLARSVMGPEIDGTALRFEDSWITDMHAADDADGIYLHGQSAGQQIVLRGGVLAAVDDDGIDTQDARVTIEDYIVRNAFDKGVSVFEGEVDINWSLIVDNATKSEDGTSSSVSAKAFHNGTAKVNVDHTTIVGVKQAGIDDVGIEARNKSNPTSPLIQYFITNSIVAATRPVKTDYALDSGLVDINVDHTNLFGEPWAGGGTGLINADPQFVDAAVYDFRLQTTSPSINAGDPAFTPLDADGTRTDQGRFTNNAFNAVDGELAGNTIWRPDDGQYHVTAPLSVPAPYTLTIMPGTTVFFANGAGLIVEGQLLAEGTAENPIRLARASTASNWTGIQFRGSTADNRIAHAVIEGSTRAAGMVDLDDSNLLLDHVYFDGANRRRITSIDSSLIVRNSTFTDFEFSGAVPNNVSEHIWGRRVLPGGQVIIENNVFGLTPGHNDAIDFDAGHRTAGNPVPQVLGNIFLGGGDEALDIEGDFHIEGNVFRQYRKDAVHDQVDGGESTAISAGNAHQVGHHYVVTGNVFYDVDHVTLIKQGSFMTFTNNTVVNVTPGPYAAVAGAMLFDLPGQIGMTGKGAYLDGNVFTDTPRVFANVDSRGSVTDLTVNRSILPAAEHRGGVDNLDADPRLADPAGGDFSLRPGSPALGAGPVGTDMGADVERGAIVSPVPLAETYLTTAAFDVAGDADPRQSAFVAYKYRLNGGPWSAEQTPGTPIILTALTDGPQRLEVVSQNSAGAWQDDTDAVTRTWTVNTALSRVLINEVLASNRTAHLHDQRSLDVIELYNDSQAAADISGWSISDNETSPRRFVFPAGTTIDAEGYLVLYADDAEPGATGLYLGFQLNADGEAVFLYDNTQTLVDSVRFGPQVADLSIGRADPDRAWALTRPTIDPSGAAAANVAQPTVLPAGVVINEWFANGDLLVEDDFIELYNPDTLPVDIAGLYVTDNPANQKTKEKIPPLGFIGAEGFVALTADGSTAPGHLDFRLGANMEILGLFNADMTQLDRIYYTPQTEDVSQGRTPDGTNNVAFFSLPTPGLANAPAITPAGTLRADLVGVHRNRSFLVDQNASGKWDKIAGGDMAYAFGADGDTPVIGDFNGDGYDQIGTWRPELKKFFLDHNGNGRWDGTDGGDVAYQWGGKVTDTPIVGDFNGDGKDEVGIHRNRNFLVDYNGNGKWDKRSGGDQVYAFGAHGDLPVIGDWNGDGVDDIGTYRPTNKKFYLDLNGSRWWEGGADVAYLFRNVLETPISGDFNGDGMDEIGTYNSGNLNFYLDATGNGRWDGTVGEDVLHRLGGTSTDTPIVGRWRPPATLLAASLPEAPASHQVDGLLGKQDPRRTESITHEEIAPILDYATDLWSTSLPGAPREEVLQHVTVYIADLPGATLGQARGNTIWIDVNAAGHGWFVDSTPTENEEFGLDAARGLIASDPSPASGRTDLRTVVLHELGHVLGWEDFDPLLNPDDLMSATLPTGVRRLSFATAVDAVIAQDF